jgi:hypothetical protein
MNMQMKYIWYYWKKRMLKVSMDLVNSPFKSSVYGEYLKSNDYKVKMEIVAYLKENGMDYWKTKIPKHLYDQMTPEYRDKY